MVIKIFLPRNTVIEFTDVDPDHIVETDPIMMVEDGSGDYARRSELVFVQDHPDVPGRWLRKSDQETQHGNPSQ